MGKAPDHRAANAHTHADDTDPRLDQLLQRWEERYQQGESLSAEALCSTCPEYLPPDHLELTNLARQRQRSVGCGAV